MIFSPDAFCNSPDARLVRLAYASSETHTESRETHRRFESVRRGSSENLSGNENWSSAVNGGERWEDGFPHGTPGGFAHGCRGAICRGGVEYGQTCRQAFTRYAGDAPYRRLVLEGASDDVLRRPATFTVPVSRSSVLQERRAAVAAARVAAKAASTRGRSHGTLAGYRRGCHKGSPCPTGADGRTCAEVMATYQIDWARRRRAQPGAQEAA
jgi:hypothetical protein